MRLARFTREDHACGASRLPKTSENDCFAVYFRPQFWQNIFERPDSILEVAMLDAEKSWEWVPSRLSDNDRASAQSFDLCFAKLICVLVNWFVFWKIGLCFKKLFCVLLNWFAFWEIDLCFDKLICVLENWFVFWETVLCFGKLICVWHFWATVDYTHVLYRMSKLPNPRSRRDVKPSGRRRE